MAAAHRETALYSWELRDRQIGNMRLCAILNPIINRYRNVFLCVAASARYRGSGEPASRRGWPSAAKRLFCKFDKVAMLILFEPLRLRHLPYPRYRAAGEDIATYPLSTASNHNAQHAEENIARLPSFTAFSLLLFYA